jgi:dTDP-glucose 4,6-dehydratase
VEDTVRGNLELAFSPHPGPVNIGNPTEVSMLALAETIRDLVGSRSPVRFVDLPVDDPKVRRPDTTLARTLLGWQPQVTVEDGLHRTAAWFAARGAAA